MSINELTFTETLRVYSVIRFTVKGNFCINVV